MKNERLEAIRSGLYQYVGALMKEVGHEGQETMHLTLAQLSEVWLHREATSPCRSGSSSRQTEADYDGASFGGS